MATSSRSRVSPRRGNGQSAVREAEAIVGGNSHLTAAITDEGVKRVWKLIRDNKISVVDLKLNDLPGLWQHFSIPVSELAGSA